MFANASIKTIIIQIVIYYLSGVILSHQHALTYLILMLNLQKNTDIKEQKSQIANKWHVSNSVQYLYRGTVTLSNVPSKRPGTCSIIQL